MYGFIVQPGQLRLAGPYPNWLLEKQEMIAELQAGRYNVKTLLRNFKSRWSPGVKKNGDRRGRGHKHITVYNIKR